MDSEASNTEQSKYHLFSNKKQVLLKDSSKEEEEKKKLYGEIEEDLKQSLLSENLIVLTGAGSSVEIGGKTMSDLWQAVEDSSDIVFDDIKKIVSYNPDDEEFIKNKNLEELLSRLQIEKRAKGANSEIDGNIKAIEKIIVKNCRFIPSEDFPHKNFLNKILQSRKKNIPRCKLFTLNYDESFEKAADDIGAVVIDGFSFSQKGEFRSIDFDLDIVQREQTRIHNEENFYKKVFHLYKLHGSVNWEKPKEGGGKILKKDRPDEALLVYPNSSKYEESYNMPFFEMIARFQMALRRQNTTLFIIGYSFSDEHINRIVEEAININESLNIFVVSQNIKNSTEDVATNLRSKLFRYAQNGYNGITLIADSFSNFTKNLPEIKYPDIEQERQRQLSLKIENKADLENKTETHED